MKQTHSTYPRTLAISPSSRGFGFAVLEGFDTLVNWGGKSAKKKDKNAQALAKAEKLIARYQPGMVVLQDMSTKTCRRSPRIKAMSKRIIALAAKQKISVKLFSHEEMNRVHFSDGEGTKHELAQIIAERFPEELGSLVPPKRRLWESEHPRMDIFDAVALALLPRMKKGKRKAQADV